MYDKNTITKVFVSHFPLSENATNIAPIRLYIIFTNHRKASDIRKADVFISYILQ